MATRRDTIIATVGDLVGELLFYGRKEDDDLPMGAIEDAIRVEEITVDEIAAEFRAELVDGLGDEEA